MRSPEEIRFRLRQELANVFLRVFPPSVAGEELSPLSGLPNPSEIATVLLETPWVTQTTAVAEEILAGRVPLLGAIFPAGTHPAWRRDYVSGLETRPIFFRRVPYLDVARSGDHKNIWELSRHQHLVLVAQAFVITGDKKYSQYVLEQLRSWWEENPFQRGINWASALEVAFRVLSWIWIFHLIGTSMDTVFRSRFLTELNRHGLHIAYNLSVYFSPNTHLLGEAVALHALGTFFPSFANAAKWRQQARTVVLEQLDRQVHPDGGYFEHSTYYHVYALDMFVLHHLIEPLPENYTSRIGAMAEFLLAVVGPSGILPFLGDDDGGRLFYPFGARNSFARATLATCSVLLGRQYFPFTKDDLLGQAVWWMGPGVLQARPAPASLPSSRHFPDTGLISMVAGHTHVLFDAGPFGPGTAGHSHSDTLSLVLQHKDAEILIDPGTYTYVGDPRWRNWFRGSEAHNTVRVDGRNQADPAGPFRWLNKPETHVNEWKTTPEMDIVDATCSYAGIHHRRRLWFLKPDLLIVLDLVDGTGEHDVEQFWHAGGPVEELSRGCWTIGGDAQLAVSPGTQCEITEGWKSDAFASKRAAPVIRVSTKRPFPVRLATAIRIGNEVPVPFVEGDSVRAGDMLFSA